MGLGVSAEVHKIAMEQDAQVDQALAEALARVTDLDTKAGLSGSLGNVRFYGSMLKRFLAGQADTIERIRRCMEGGDRANAEMMAHTLKGVSASLGANRLAQLAESLERSLRTGATPEACSVALTRTEEVLNALLTDLRAIPGIAGEPEAGQRLTQEERNRAQTMLQTIGQWLADDDARACELWEANASLLKAVAPHGEQLDTAIRQFDYELSLQLLHCD